MDRSAVKIIEGRIEWHIRECQRLLNRVSARPRQNDVHSLRIVLKRLEADRRFLRPGALQPKPLRKMAKLLSRRRRLDVAIRDAKDASVRTKNLCRKRRQIDRLIINEDIEKIRQTLEGWTLSTPVAVSLRRVQMQRHALRKSVVGWHNHPPHSKRRMHQFRIAMKGVRYTLESLGHKVPQLVRLQKRLGRLHDLETAAKLTQKKSKFRLLEKHQKKLARRSIAPAIQEVLRLTNRDVFGKTV